MSGRPSSAEYAGVLGLGPCVGGLHVTPGAEARVRVAKSGRRSGLLAKSAGSCRPQAWGSGTRCLTGCSKGCPGKGMRGRAGSRM